MSENDLLVEVKDLKTYFYLYEGIVRAVDGVSLAIHRGKTLGIIGESGCGKSVLAQSLLRIVPSPPGKIVGGQMLLHRGQNGQRDVTDLAQLDPAGEEIRRIRGKEIAMIFQEPMTSFGPLNTIGDQIIETILLHKPGTSKGQARALATEMLGRVGIPRPERHVDAYPHQLSGGMRQRAMIAMALSCQPSLLLADEPTTALDVTIQAQILSLLRQLRQEFGMAIMFITHALGVIAEIADEVVVMYLGRVVEQARIDDLFYDPRHPYTAALLRSIPRVDRRAEGELPAIEGVVPDPYEVPPGCSFSDRCRHFMPGLCDRAVPRLKEVTEQHWVRCYLYGQEVDAGQPEVVHA